MVPGFTNELKRTAADLENQLVTLQISVSGEKFLYFYMPMKKNREK